MQTGSLGIPNTGPTNPSRANTGDRCAAPGFGGLRADPLNPTTVNKIESLVVRVCGKNTGADAQRSRRDPRASPPSAWGPSAGPSPPTAPPPARFTPSTPYSSSAARYRDSFRLARPSCLRSSLHHVHPSDPEVLQGVHLRPTGVQQPLVHERARCPHQFLELLPRG